jgi:hypothetical protein
MTAVVIVLPQHRLHFKWLPTRMETMTNEEQQRNSIEGNGKKATQEQPPQPCSLT